jgi:hypothetical protein
MADEKTPGSDSSENSNAEEVFSLFIFKTGPNPLKSAETYLKNRKWIVGSGYGMREVLAYIIQKKPQYVMVAADHTNRKVKILPKLISQAFPVKVIAFAEGSSTASINALREMNQPYSLFPPVSGPSIERLIRKIIKDEKDDAEKSAELAKNGGLNPDGSPAGDANQGTILLKGEKGSAGESQSSFEQARAALAALANGSDDDNQSGIAYNPNQENDGQGPQSSYMGSGSSGLNGDSITQEGHGPGQAYNQQQQGGGAANTYNQQQQGGGAANTYNQQQQGGGAANTYNQQQQGGGAANTYNQQQQGGGAANTYNQQQQGGGAAGGTAAKTQPSAFDQDGNPVDTESSDWKGLAEKPGPHGAENTDLDFSRGSAENLSAEAIEKRKQKYLYIKGKEKELTQNDSLVIRGAVEAMDSTTVHIEGEDQTERSVKKLESSSNVFCITIESPRFSGYLVAALGKNRKMDDSFIDMVKQRLFSFLKANGESASEENSMDIKIKEVAFEDWAIQQAEFLRKSVHQGEEIAMAFFPNNNVTVKLEESASDKMLKMSIDELKEDVPLEFDLYMYMPENDKYLLYTPQGRPLAGNQKGRLKEKGMTHMHLKKESVGDVKKYRAQNFLNAKIEAFNQKKNGS